MRVKAVAKDEKMKRNHCIYLIDSVCVCTTDRHERTRLLPNIPHINECESLTLQTHGHTYEPNLHALNESQYARVVWLTIVANQ